MGIKNRRFIDKKNIHTATLAAMSDAVKDLIEKYCRLKGKEESDIRNDICVLVDGNCKPPLPYRIIPIVNGDSKSLSVAAASIIAKVERDRRIEELAKQFGRIGSGYSHDPLTISFLQKWMRSHRQLPPFARKAWDTNKRI